MTCPLGGHMHCFHPCPNWISHHGTNPSPPPPRPTHTHTPDCSSVTKMTLYFVQKDVSHSIFCQAYCASGCCVCVRVCTRVRTCDCFHLFIRCTRYLLSVCSVPGTVAKFLWVCLLMPLLLLEGSFCALFIPKLLPLCQSGRLRFCASLCAFLSLSLCRALFVCLSLPWCLTLPLCLLVTLGLRRPLSCPWAHQPP